MVPRGRYSVSRTPSLFRKMIIITFPADLSWCSRVGVYSPSLFQLAERIVVVSPGLITGYDAIRKLGWIYFALLQKLLTTISVATIFMLMISWIMTNSSARRQIDHALRSVLRLQCFHWQRWLMGGPFWVHL